MKYLVIEDQTIDGVEEKVNRALNNGFILAGNLFYANMRYYQPLIRYDGLTKINNYFVNDGLAELLNVQ